MQFSVSEHSGVDEALATEVLERKLYKEFCRLLTLPLGADQRISLEAALHGHLRTQRNSLGQELVATVDSLLKTYVHPRAQSQLSKWRRFLKQQMV
jgi:hypothetical protein